MVSWVITFIVNRCFPDQLNSQQSANVLLSGYQTCWLICKMWSISDRDWGSVALRVQLELKQVSCNFLMAMKTKYSKFPYHHWRHTKFYFNNLRMYMSGHKTRSAGDRIGRIQKVGVIYFYCEISITLTWHHEHFFLLHFKMQFPNNLWTNLQSKGWCRLFVQTGQLGCFCSQSNSVQIRIHNFTELRLMILNINVYP